MRIRSRMSEIRYQILVLLWMLIVIGLTGCRQENPMNEGVTTTYKVALISPQ